MSGPTKTQQEMLEKRRRRIRVKTQRAHLERNNAALMSGEELLERAIAQFMERENLDRLQAILRATTEIQQLLRKEMRT